MSFSNPVVGGLFGELIRAAIRSPNYVTGVSGWTINRDGSAEFNNVTIRLDLATGSIVVGPAGQPQVEIGSTANHGFIQFPTNEAFETSPAQIYADKGTVTDTVRLHIDSGTTEAGLGDSAQITLISAEDGVANDESISMRVALVDITLQNGLIELSANEVEVTNDILLATSQADSNYPARVVRGKKVNANTITTLPIGVDTEVATSDVTTAYLVNGVAYEVEVNLSTRSSVGTSAAGTQVVAWKLWDGAVGGTQLGQTAQKTNGSVGTIANDDYFRFTFNYAGTTGSKTLRISGNKLSGTDTFQAIMNTASSVIVKRIGDPAKITNL